MVFYVYSISFLSNQTLSQWMDVAISDKTIAHLHLILLMLFNIVQQTLIDSVKKCFFFNNRRNGSPLTLTLFSLLKALIYIKNSRTNKLNFNYLIA